MLPVVFLSAADVGEQPVGEHRFLLIRGTLYVSDLPSHPLILRHALPHEPVSSPERGRLTAAGIISEAGVIT